MHFDKSCRKSIGEKKRVSFDVENRSDVQRDVVPVGLLDFLDLRLLPSAKLV